MKAVLLIVLVCAMAYPQLMQKQSLLKTNNENFLRKGSVLTDTSQNELSWDDDDFFYDEEDYYFGDESDWGWDDDTISDEEWINHIHALLDWEDSELDALQDALLEDDEEDKVEYKIKYWRSDEYQLQSRYDKLEQLWGELVPDEEITDVEPMDFLWKDFPELFTQKSNGSFCQDSDGLKNKRHKVVHAQGVVAKVEWIPVENEEGYTGIYETGSDTVIMRLSETANLSSESKGLTPSIALKFLVDNKRSQNVLAMHSMKPNTGSWNFFENQMQNRVPAFDPDEDSIEFETFHKKMLEASKCPYGLAVGHIGDKGNDGEFIKPLVEPVIPYELHFESSFKEALDDEELADKPWYRQLQAVIPKGSIILDVYAVTAPTSLEESKRVKVAEVKLLTDLYTSKHGDERLYFQHKRIQSDRKYYPKKWKKLARETELCFSNEDEETFGNEVPEGVWPENDSDAKFFFEHQQRTSGCPFAWLLE